MISIRVTYKEAEIVVETEVGVQDMIAEAKLAVDNLFGADAPEKTVPVRKSRAKKKPTPEESDDSLDEETPLKEDSNENKVEQKQGGGVSVDDLREAVQAFIKVHGSVRAKQLITDHGGTRISDVPEDQRESLYDLAVSGIAK